MGLPGDLKNDPLGPFIATHHIILAHAAAAKLYKEKYQVNTPSLSLILIFPLGLFYSLS